MQLMELPPAAKQVIAATGLAFTLSLRKAASRAPLDPRDEEWALWMATVETKYEGLQQRKAPKHLPGWKLPEWHLIYGSLWGEGKLEKLDIWRSPKKIIDGQVVALVRLGDKICGHQKFIHGGFTSALLDQLFGYQFGTLRREAGLGATNFTANLNVDYRLPMPRNSLFICRLWVEKIVDGRKGYLRAVIEDREGKVYAESTSLFVVPRHAITRDTCDPKVKNYVAPSAGSDAGASPAPAACAASSAAELEKAKSEWMRTHQQRGQRR